MSKPDTPAVCARLAGLASSDVARGFFGSGAQDDRDGSYAQWRAHCNRRLQSEPSGLYSAESWAATVESNSWSVVLLPVEPGVVRSSAAVVQPGRRARRAGAAAKGSQLPLSLSGNPLPRRSTGG